MRNGIMSPHLPAPAGPYSHVVRAGDLVVCSGQGGISPDGVLADGITAQAEQCFANVLVALAAASAAETDIVKVGVY
ncbi:MAG: RidA family protein, partial [Pseudolysinimonas sp.]